MRNWLVLPRPDKLDFSKAFSGSDRAFFVGTDVWVEVKRPVSQRFGGQQVKVQGRWHFIYMDKAPREYFAEVGLVNMFLAWKYPQGSPFRSFPTRGQPRLGQAPPRLPVVLIPEKAKDHPGGRAVGRWIRRRILRRRSPRRLDRQ